MALDSVVIMSSNIGCVCRAATPMPGPPGSSSAGAAAAVDAIIEQENAQAVSYSQQPVKIYTPPPPQ